MRRLHRWSLTVGCVMATLGVALRAHSEDQTTPGSPPPMAAPQAAQPEAASAPVAPERAVYTFADEAKMREFAAIWQQRQALLVRMSVLQAYWDEERAALGTLNEQLQKTYSLDVSKSYVLDTDRRVLVEREAPAGSSITPGIDASAQAIAAPPSSPQPAETSGP